MPNLITRAVATHDRSVGTLMDNFHARRAALGVFSGLGARFQFRPGVGLGTRQFLKQVTKGPNTLQNSALVFGYSMSAVDSVSQFAHCPKMPLQSALESLKVNGLNRPLFLVILLRSSLLKPGLFRIRKSDFGV